MEKKSDLSSATDLSAAKKKAKAKKKKGKKKGKKAAKKKAADAVILYRVAA
jgi:hypothetical protein